MSIVSCANLGKRYQGTVALDAINLELDAGEPIALIGPNGAGKTTLLSLLCGFIRPSDGQVAVLGHAPGSAALHGRVSALPQDAQLDPRFSVGRQLRLFAELQGFGRKAAQAEAKRVLEWVDLSDTANSKPAELSHGMRKRISIAQALLGSPELILLDEPTAGLDPANVKAVRNLIVSLTSVATFVVSSHNLDELEKLCGTVVHLDKGRLQNRVDIANDGNDGYLTIKLHKTDTQQAMASLHTLSGIIHVAQKQQGEIVLQYDVNSHPNMDQQLLNFLAENNWAYKHLINGRTLEDKLFF